MPLTVLDIFKGNHVQFTPVRKMMDIKNVNLWECGYIPSGMRCFD